MSIILKPRRPGFACFERGAHSLSLATWVGTPSSIVRKMLDMAQTSCEDVVYDLGSGDARILITAVKEFKARKAVGYEIREDLYEISKQNIKQLNLQNRVMLIRGDLLKADLSEASIINLYLSSEANEILRPKLEKHVSPQTRVVSYLFPIHGWRAAKIMDLSKFSFTDGCFIGMLYLYVIPQAFE